MPKPSTHFAPTSCTERHSSTMREVVFSLRKWEMGRYVGSKALVVKYVGSSIWRFVIQMEMKKELATCNISQETSANSWT